MDCIGFSDFSYERRGGRAADSFNDAYEFQPPAATPTEEPVLETSFFDPPSEGGYGASETDTFSPAGNPNAGVAPLTGRDAVSLSSYALELSFEHPPLH